MNKHTSKSSNQSEDDNEHVYGMRKITYLEKYGVKRFPYRGRRQRTPILQQYFDGRISISNDVFSLTIHQFEKEFKACLKRRKQNSQWILNVRFPVKSSNEYLEYLEKCEDHDEGYTYWSEDNSHQQYVYEQLVNIVGKETDIRLRQRLFLVQDVITNSMHPATGFTHISSGSLAEGMSLPGSDLDIMYVLHGIKVVNREQDIPIPNEFATLVMEIDPNYPGFSRLKLAGGFETSSPLLKKMVTETDEGLYLAPHKFISIFQQQHTIPLSLHGPCVSDKCMALDIAVCFRNKLLPYNAKQWVYRQRKQWPPNAVIDTIMRFGCLLVPIGPKTVTNNQFLWRLSFSVAEKHLLHSFNYTQLLCYGLLKLTLKHIINKNPGVEDLLCSYFLKTTLFWLSEEVSIETFQLENLFNCFKLCLGKLRSWVENSYCPNYFIPEQNMFAGKIDTTNNQILLRILDSMICDKTVGLATNVFSKVLASTMKNNSSIQLDFLFYKIFAQFGNPKNLDLCFRGLIAVQYLLQSESSVYIRDVCRRWISNINQYIPQQLPSLVRRKNIENIRSRYHKHLQDALQQDAVTGWLLYASFYYVIGQYNVTIRIVDHVLLKCTPDKVYQGLVFYLQRQINYYAKFVHMKSITLNEKLRLATISPIRYLQHSSLIPYELQLEIQKCAITVPPVVLSHCLKFLCYYHLGDSFNRHQALRDLCLAVEEKFFISPEQLSLSLTICGVCTELSGDIETACQCYDKAFRCDNNICITAKIRKTRLLKRQDLKFS
ncbi:uncharacterized protein [Mytilus edulis]|uniref:uncharacterized protein n=1 Tax=Mytilus edulis TaxID=6550 RepID=UPI0039F0FE54